MKTKRLTKKDVKEVKGLVKELKSLDVNKNETLMDVVREIRSIVKKLQPSDRVIIQGNASTRMVEKAGGCSNPNISSAGICLTCGYRHGY